MSFSPLDGILLHAKNPGWSAFDQELKHVGPFTSKPKCKCKFLHSNVLKMNPVTARGTSNVYIQDIRWVDSMMQTFQMEDLVCIFGMIHISNYQQAPRFCFDIANYCQWWTKYSDTLHS